MTEPEFNPSVEQQEPLTISVNKATKMIGLVLASLTLFGLVGSWVDGRYAKAEDVRRLERKFEQGIATVEIAVLESKRSQLDSQVFELEQREKKGNLDSDGQRRLRDLRQQVKTIDLQIQELYRRNNR